MERELKLRYVCRTERDGTRFRRFIPIQEETLRKTTGKVKRNATEEGVRVTAKGMRNPDREIRE